MFRAMLSCLALAAVALVASAFYWSAVPDPMPSHWNLHGQVDGFMPRSVGLMMSPAIALLMGLGLAVAGRRGNSSPALARAAGTICVWAAAFFVLVHGLMIHAAITPGHPLSVRVLMAGLGLLFVVIGRVMPDLPRNRWCGVRVSWTLNSDRVWAATHRFAGPCFVSAGVAVMASCTLPPAGMISVLLVAVFGGCLIAPLVFAKLAWDTDQRGRR